MTEKQLAAEKAAEFVKDNMIVGLGTGSTAAFAVKKLGELVNNGLKIRGVSTSNATTALAQSLGIPLISLDEVDQIDLTIDGADEIDPDFNGIKGGGGALLFEKIVASASRKNIWVVDSAKMVKQLGKFPLPAEVLTFGYSQTFKRLQEKGYNPVIRQRENKTFMTDKSNYIIDLHLEKIEEPYKIEKELNIVPGVLENGLFLNKVDVVVVGRGNTTEILYNKKKNNLR